MMQALVLAAGLGTRLRPLTEVRAKPAIPVAGEPIIRRIVRWLYEHGVTDLVVNLHYLPHTVTAVLGDGSDLSVRIRYSWEQPRILGSAGGPRQALDILGSDVFLIVNGDTLTDLNVGALIDMHVSSAALVTLALVPNREPGEYGGVLLEQDGSVTGFVQRGPSAIGSYHFIGVQVACAETFRRARARAAGEFRRWRLRRADRSTARLGSRIRDRCGVLGRRHGRGLRAYVRGVCGAGSPALNTVTDERTAEGPAATDRINQYLGEQGLAGPNTRVVPLTGDASDRRYFRVISPDGTSRVLALHAAAIEFRSLPFASVARLLQQLPLPIPAILDHSDALGIIALQDLGDVTLQAHLGVASAAEHAELYRQAVALIERLQRRGAALGPSEPVEGYTPYEIAFDVERLTWELGFFVRHFIEAYRGAVLRDKERAAFGWEWRAITRDLSAEPRVLCHRDYHSRNLMLHHGGLHIIDFQDARMGP